MATNTPEKIPTITRTTSIFCCSFQVLKGRNFKSPTYNTHFVQFIPFLFYYICSLIMRLSYRRLKFIVIFCEPFSSLQWYIQAKLCSHLLLDTRKIYISLRFSEPKSQAKVYPGVANRRCDKYLRRDI